jgi:hypothetical protein
MHGIEVVSRMQIAKCCKKFGNVLVHCFPYK